MPDVFITETEARVLLRVYLRERGRGSRNALSAKTGIAATTISTMLTGDRTISPLIGAELGLRAVRGFVRARRDG